MGLPLNMKQTQPMRINRHPSLDSWEATLRQTIDDSLSLSARDGL